MSRPCGAALAMVAALALGATGCSGDGEPDGDAESAAAAPDPEELREGLADLYAGTGATETGAQTASCFADALLERTDAATLADAGLVVDGSVVGEAPPLPEATARDWFAAQEECTDYVTVSARAQRAATRGAIDEPAYAECLRGLLSDARVEDAVVATLMGEWEDPAVAELSRAQSTCAERALPRD